MKSSCNTETLVVSEACEVHLCPDCNTVHFSMGPLSLRLREKHFEQIAEDLREAMFQLKKIRTPESYISTDVGNITRIHR